MLQIKELMYEDVKNMVVKYMNEEYVVLVEWVYYFVVVVYQGQVCKFGEFYIIYLI